MPTEMDGCWVASERVPLPAMTFADTFHWNGLGTLSRDGEPMMGSLDTLPSGHAALDLAQDPCDEPRQRAPGCHVRPIVSRSELSPVCAATPQAIDWAREVACLTVALDPRLLLAAARDAISGVTGKLVWICEHGPAQSLMLYGHPMLLVSGAAYWLQRDGVEIVLHLPSGDPLLHHMMLVLQAAIDAEDLPGRLYAEALTQALALHLLRRYAACRLPTATAPSALSKLKLGRTTAYIEAHLAHALSVTDLAAVAQTSPAHFARLFRQATGQTPHQYIIRCRIEQAKRLLRETARPIVEISQHVGFTDQSYFTVVFHRYVAMTPRAYRDDTRR